MNTDEHSVTIGVASRRLTAQSSRRFMARTFIATVLALCVAASVCAQPQPAATPIRDSVRRLTIIHPELLQSAPPRSVPSAKRGFSKKAVLVGFGVGCGVGGALGTYTENGH